MRSFTTLRNSAWGIVQQVIVCVISLFSRRVMIETIGQQGVGLNALLTSIISLLSLAELGIGTAIVFHMYGPIARNDKLHIARLMHCYKMVYRVIALAILLIGVCILPFMKWIVRDVSYSNAYVMLIFILFLVQTTSSYFFTYKRSMLIADQKQYVIAIFDLIYKVVTIIGGIVVLKMTGELAYYLILLIIGTVLNNMLISKYVDKQYPYINEMKERLPGEELRSIFRDVKNIFVGKLSGVITTSTDNILITAFVGTIQTGLFSNYTIIFNTLVSVTKQLSGGMRGSVGNLIAVEQPEHVKVVLERMLFMMFLIASFCAGCLTGLVDRFITLAFGDGLLIGRTTVYILILNLYIMTLDIPISSMVAAAGMFRYDKWIAITGTVMNLIVSVIFGKMYGMAGILAGTAVTYVIQFSFKLIIFYAKYLKQNGVRIFAKIGLFTLTTVLECIVIAFICGQVYVINAYVSFLICAGISALLPVVIGSLLFCRTNEFQYTIAIIKTICSKIFGKRGGELAQH
ncbi:MAG: lipopolysaccharide biosynthesis protein [Clostridia bacterium]|nr:lipopolysaccharide biosynthesis protein [Clostridia bacterium]